MVFIGNRGRDLLYIFDRLILNLQLNHCTSSPSLAFTLTTTCTINFALALRTKLYGTELVA